MLKRSLASVVLSLCLVGLVATDGAAICRIVLSKLACSDICLQYFLSGVGNVDVNTVAVCGGIYVDKVYGQCYNKPYNSTNAQGTVFFPGITLTESAFVKAQNLTDQRGNAYVELCLGTGFDDVVLEWLRSRPGCSILDPAFTCDNQETQEVKYCSGAGLCPNSNWWFDPCSAVIDQIHVYYSAWQIDKRTGKLAVSSQICRNCLPDPSQPCGFACKDVSPSECQSRQLYNNCDTTLNPPPPTNP